MSEKEIEKERLKEEQADLRDRLTKLVGYLDTDHYDSLEVVEQVILTKQSDIMLQYLAILEHRLQIWKD